MAQLKIHNSLKPGPATAFVPMDRGKVSWYACGPTVYDHSHLGHARNYVSTDIIRRIMMHYFGLEVKFVMNITDIDDKIILAARRLKLLEREKLKTHSQAELKKMAADAFQTYAAENLPELLKSPDGVALNPSNYATRRDAAYGKVLAGGTLTGEGKAGDDEAKMKMYLSNLSAAAVAIQQDKIFGGADEILLPYLDSLYQETIDAKDHTIWTDVTQFWERQFMKDMEDLNVIPADVITRVTEYVPQIVDFVDKIITKGFAYDAEESVWFDIAAFEKAGNTYGRLRPQNRNDKSLQEDGEGSLGRGLSGKRGEGDFALWKKSKAGEPSWPSPWGQGRPGWHIECSVMASDILGSEMDIHSGGIDLAFPHHENELAQSEAYYCEHGHEHLWVKTFMHMGHLSISGSKMSKSLKNFQTIRDALRTDYTPRSMRIVFLLGKWNDGVEVSPSMRSMANSWETGVNNFFINVKSHILAQGPADLESLSLKENKSDGLLANLEKAKNEMTIALCNSFDTPQALRIIDDLISKANINMKSMTDIDVPRLEKIARWVTKMVGIFGLDSNSAPPYDGLGWASENKDAWDSNLTPEQIVTPYRAVYSKVKQQVLELSLHSEVLDTILAADVDSKFQSLVADGTSTPEVLAMPYIRAVSETRDEIRKLAPSSPSKKAILALSDQIRDTDLTNLGVYLDDAGADSSQGAFIKFVPASELRAQREEKAAKEREKIAQKEAAKLTREKEEAEKAEKAKVPPTEMFKDERYLAWDDNGIPTKTSDGKEVTKSALKKLTKDWERQKKAHEDWKAKSGGS